MTDPQQTDIFERVVRPHFDRLYRLAWRLTGTKAEAEDLFQELLVKAFGLLDDIVEEHRLVVLLHDTEGYKLSEIEEITGVPVGTIKSRLHRARARLRQILIEDGTFS